MVLLENLEKKINLKLEKQELINDKLSDNFDNMKNETYNLKSQVEKNTKNIGNVYEQIDIIFGRLNDIKILIDDKELVLFDLNEKIEKVKNWVNEKLDE